METLEPHINTNKEATLTLSGDKGKFEVREKPGKDTGFVLEGILPTLFVQLL